MAINSFDLSFDLLMKSAGSPGDGFSFNFGDLNTSTPGDFEEGFPSNGGDVLSVSWDTYTNSGADIAGRGAVYLNGVEVAGLDNTASIVVENTVDSAFQNVEVSWSNSTGLSVNYGGTDVYSDDALALNPNAGDLFAFAARTGGAKQDVFIDNICLSTVPEPAASGIVIGLPALLWVGFVRRRGVG